MSQNKNVLLRYRVIDRCLSSGRTDYTIAKLLDTVNEALSEQGLYGIAERQLREDLRNMHLLYNAPIGKGAYKGQMRYYTYSERDYSIFNSNISDEDYNALKATIDMLGKYKSSNVWLQEVITNLECRFDILPSSEKLVLFDENARLKGLNFLSDIIECTINHKAVDIVYRSFRGHEEEYFFNPYCVKQYNGRWFVLGYEAKYGRLSNFALDRIQRIKRSSRIFIENENIDIENYYKDIIGVTVPDTDVLEVRLKFDESRFPYVVSKPLHHSQKIVDVDERIIEIRVKKNNELKQAIFSYMPNIEVLSPFSLREEIKNEIEYNLGKYK